MPRVKRSTKRNDRRKKILKRASGYFLTKSKLYQAAQEAVERALKFAYTGRKQKKRQYRALWIVRINAACRINGMSYSTFINGLKLAGNGLDRKVLADIAANDAAGFAALTVQAKAALKMPLTSTRRTAPRPQPKPSRTGRGAASVAPLLLHAPRLPDLQKRSRSQFKERKPSPGIYASLPTASCISPNLDPRRTASLSRSLHRNRSAVEACESFSCSPEACRALVSIRDLYRSSMEPTGIEIPVSCTLYADCFTHDAAAQSSRRRRAAARPSSLRILGPLPHLRRKDPPAPLAERLSRRHRRPAQRSAPRRHGPQLRRRLPPQRRQPPRSPPAWTA